MPALTPCPSVLETLFRAEAKSFDTWRAAEDRALEAQTDEELRQHMSTYDVNAWAALSILTHRHNRQLEKRRE